MMLQIRKYSRDFAAVIVLAIIAAVVGGYILSNQRFYLPKSIPVLGSDFVDYKAEFTTAQSVTPGQGQTVNVAGVPVGEIAKVDLKDGRAVVTMKIRAKYTPLYKNASALLRPKTGLNDMMIELSPGTKAAGELPRKQPIQISQTLPNVNADEILAALDGDTRAYLQLLVQGGGQALGGNGKNLSATFKRFEPLNRDIRRITRLLAKRRVNISRTIHNFRQLSDAVGEKDTELAQLVDSSNAVFKAFANQDANLRQSLQLLPDTLKTTQSALGKADKLALQLGPTLGKLRPGARALGPTLVATRPFLRDTTPVIKNQLRPFARDALPVVKILRPAADDLAQITPDLTSSIKVLNQLFNELAYNPPGKEEGYLFWASWASHAGATVFSTQDAHGPIRRGLFLVSCSSLATLEALQKVNPLLGTLIGLLDTPKQTDVCPASSQAGSGTAPGSTPPAATTPTPQVPPVPALPVRSAK
jgi:phospholipid/cholesterol/gamma-HCH transport system substrate-binding protein